MLSMTDTRRLDRRTVEFDLEPGVELRAEVAPVGAFERAYLPKSAISQSRCLGTGVGRSADNTEG
jgi:hypothetical protein